jgi:hypothetical protein
MIQAYAYSTKAPVCLSTFLHNLIKESQKEKLPEMTANFCTKIYI